MTPLHVLVALGRYRNTETGECFPSIGTLARELDKTRRTIQRHIETLIAAGFLLVRSRRSTDGRRMTSNVYIILYPPVQPVTPTVTKEPDGEEHGPKGHDTQRHGGHDTQCHDGAAADGQFWLTSMTPSVAPLMTLGDGHHDTGCRNNYPTGTNPSNEPFAQASAPSAPHAGKASEFYVQHAARDGLTPDQIQRSYDELHADLMHQGMRAEQATAMIANLSMFYRPQPKGLAIIRREAVKHAGAPSTILRSHQR